MLDEPVAGDTGNMVFTTHAFVQFDPTVGHFGTLYWSDAQTRERFPEQSMPLESVSAVQLGKLASIWEHPQLSGADSKRCLSLESRDGLMLHFEASSEQARNALALGLHTAIIDAGKKVAVDQALDVDAAASRIYAYTAEARRPPETPLARPMSPKSFAIPRDAFHSDGDEARVLDFDIADEDELPMPHGPDVDVRIDMPDAGEEDEEGSDLSMDETTRAALEEMQRALTSLPDTLEEVKAVPANDEVKLFEIIEHEISSSDVEEPLDQSVLEPAAAAAAVSSWQSCPSRYQPEPAGC